VYGRCDPVGHVFTHISSGDKTDVNILLVAVAYVVNVTVAFASDGQWKTAGDGLVQPCWRLLGRAQAVVRANLYDTTTGALGTASLS
jgi:hypothetical protein